MNIPHCWHRTSLMRGNAIPAECICCFCGARGLMKTRSDRLDGHGHYVPYHDMYRLTNLEPEGGECPMRPVPADLERRPTEIME